MSSLVSRFARLRRTCPTRPLIYVPASGQMFTADDVWQMHHAFEAELRARTRPGQLLLTATGNRAETIPLLLAARAAGLAVAAADTGTTAAELSDLARQFDAAATVVRDTSADPAAAIALPGGLAMVGLRPSAHAAYRDTALLKITSGSTGVPKAALATDEQLMADSEQIAAGMAIGPDDTQIAVIPLSHAYGLSVVLVPLLIQGTPMVLRDSFVPQQLPGDVATYGARVFAGVPYMFDYFLNNPPSGGWPAPLRTLISAGAPLPDTTVRDFHRVFGVRIHSFYGASESGGICFEAGDDAEGDGTVGTPLPGVTVTLRPDADAPAGSGRIHVRSAAVASGYVGEDGEGFCDGGFLTGDYGTLDPAGRLRLTGRVSTFINVAGRKVQPTEVEQVLRQMPGVRDVRVFGVDDPQRGEQVVACVAADRRSAAALGVMAVRQFCSARLAPHKIPRTVVVLDAIPLTARGKTDRRALQEAVRATIAGITEQMC